MGDGLGMLPAVCNDRVAARVKRGKCSALLHVDLTTDHDTTLTEARILRHDRRFPHWDRDANRGD